MSSPKTDMWTIITIISALVLAFLSFRGSSSTNGLFPELFLIIAAMYLFGAYFSFTNSASWSRTVLLVAGVCLAVNNVNGLPAEGFTLIAVFAISLVVGLIPAIFNEVRMRKAVAA